MDISESRKKKDHPSFHRHPWETARGQIIMDLLRQARELSADHIVDIGCGDGYIAGLLTENNLARSYTAIDSALDAGMMASLSGQYKTIRFFPSIRDTSGRIPVADIILILDVLEHVASEKDLLDEIKTIIPMAPDTKWIITVPAFQGVFSHHDTLLGHYRRYTLGQLTEVCKKNDMSVEKKGYFFFSLLAARALIRRAERPGPGKKDSTIEDWKGKKFLTAVFILILRIDYTIGKLTSKIGIRIPGLSCYCICHQSR